MDNEYGMDNRSIAEIFHTVADIYEIKGENTFRVISYRNGAETVEGLGVELATLFADKGVAGIIALHGIGKGMAGKIVELISTGKCASIEELINSIPSGLLDILSLNGMGPKKTGVVYRELGIESIERLEAAADSGGLQTLPGFGLKTEQKILKAITAKRSFEGVFRLSIGRKKAADMIEYLKEVPGVSRAEVAGSIRRWKESIGDIDLIVISSKPEAVMDAFVVYDGITEVVMSGAKKSTVRLENGLKVDLRVLREDEYGSAILHFTGSRAHNVILRERAKKMGLKVSEYGVFELISGKRVAGSTEEEVYKALGLSFIPPELREDRGEVEAVLEDRLPGLIQTGDIKGDLHCHTTASDGANTVEEMAEAAMGLGYRYMAVTDHSKGLTIAHGLDSARLIKQIEDIDAYNRKLREEGTNFRVLRGTEVDIHSDGSLDHSDELLARLDIVVAAVHSGFSMPKEKMTARVIAAIETGLVNIVAHPTGRLIGRREPFAIDIEAVLQAAKEYGVAMEVNSYPERLDLNDVHLRLAKEIGVKIAISTDSHATGQFANIEYGIHTAQRGWIEPGMVINSLPLDGLLDFLGHLR